MIYSFLSHWFIMLAVAPLIVICLIDIIKSACGYTIESPIRGIVLLFLVCMLVYYPWLKTFKNKKIIIFRIAVYELYLIPAIFSFFALFIVISTIDLSGFFSTLILMSSMTIPSLLIIFKRRTLPKDEEKYYLKTVRIILDYSDGIFWIILTVVLFVLIGDDELNIKAVIDKETAYILKYLLFPFMIQIKIVKAHIGRRMFKLEDVNTK